MPHDCDLCSFWVGGFRFDGSIACGVEPCSDHAVDPDQLAWLRAAMRRRVAEIRRELAERGDHGPS